MNLSFKRRNKQYLVENNLVCRDMGRSSAIMKIIFSLVDQEHNNARQSEGGNNALSLDLILY